MGPDHTDAVACDHARPSPLPAAPELQPPPPSSSAHAATPASPSALTLCTPKKNPQELLADVKARGKKQVYIFKPDAGCQGRGIRLCQGGKEEAVLKLLKEMEQPNVVAQHYLAKPLLVNGYKFDMRIYALVCAEGGGGRAQGASQQWIHSSAGSAGRHSHHGRRGCMLLTAGVLPCSPGIP